MIIWEEEMKNCCLLRASDAANAAKDENIDAPPPEEQAPPSVVRDAPVNEPAPPADGEGEVPQGGGSQDYMRRLHSMPCGKEQAFAAAPHGKKRSRAGRTYPPRTPSKA